jgi:hypothetical protein
MGQEIKCHVEESPEGKALLEMGELVFRGPFRLQIPFQTITSLAAGRAAGLVDINVCSFFPPTQHSSSRAALTSPRVASQYAQKICQLSQMTQSILHSILVLAAQKIQVEQIFKRPSMQRS